MTTQVIEAAAALVVAKFPLLARDTLNGFAVMFTAPTSGTVVHAVEPFTLGEHRSIWTDCRNRAKWEILPPGTKVEITV